MSRDPESQDEPEPIDEPDDEPAEAPEKPIPATYNPLSQ